MRNCIRFSSYNFNIDIVDNERPRVRYLLSRLSTSNYNKNIILPFELVFLYFCPRLLTKSLSKLAFGRHGLSLLHCCINQTFIALTIRLIEHPFCGFPRRVQQPHPPSSLSSLDCHIFSQSSSSWWLLPTPTAFSLRLRDRKSKSFHVTEAVLQSCARPVLLT